MSEPPFDYDEVFDEDYLLFFAPLLEERVEEETELIWRLLGLDTGSRVLDLACGHGRIANRLARRGAQVTGLDRSRLFLDWARESAASAGVEVDYVLGDMRKLPWPEESFDAIVNWFSAFGYFNDEENRAVLAEACRVLRPGGRLAIEGNNLAELLPRWHPAQVIERDGAMVIDQPHFDPVTGRVTTLRTIIRGASQRRFRFSLRMLMAAELADWLHAAGFAAAEFVDGAGDPLRADGRRMIALARR